MSPRREIQASTIGSLFAGIGGLELGLERAGLGPVLWQVESDPFCRQVLAKHWPDADRSVTDVRSAAARRLPRVDIICGGFPCQNVSGAGKKEGINAARSGLWAEYAQIVEALRPRFVIVENVSVLLRRGLGRVLGDLAALGYDAEWSCITACAVGAPHMRERLFVVAHANDRRQPARPVDAEVARVPTDAGEVRHGWAPEPCHDRVADGTSTGLDRRLHALGNAVVPQCAEVVARVVRRMAA